MISFLISLLTILKSSHLTFVNERVKHNVEHFITTEGPPIHGHRRRLPPEKFNIAREEFIIMKAMDTSSGRSNSQWASPLHMVPKESGKWRPCGDYRTPKQCYSTRQIHDTTYTGSLIKLGWLHNISRRLTLSEDITKLQ